MFEGQAQLDEPAQRSIWDPLPMVIVGYVLDQFGLSIKRHVLVLRCDGRVIWARDIPSADAGMEPAPIPWIPVLGPSAEVRSARPQDEEGQEAQ